MNLTELQSLELEIENFDFKIDNYKVNPIKLQEFIPLLTKYCDLSNKLNHYWLHCSYRTYKATIEERLKEYQNKYVDAEPIDFYKEELSIITAPVSMDTLYGFAPDMRFRINEQSSLIGRHYLGNKIARDFNLAYEKKTKFLREKIDKIKNPPIKHTKPAKEETPIQVDTDLVLTAMNQKIILLYRLGVIDSLKEKYTYLSLHQIAGLIGKFTGLKQNTVYGWIQPIYNENNEQKNNPLNSDKGTKIIETYLKELGIHN